MAKVIFTIEGLKEAQDALQNLPKATAKNVMRRVLLKRAEPIALAAWNRAPVADGDLRNSIGVSTKLSKRQKRMHRKQDPNDVEVFVGAGPLPQAHLTEFGSVHNRPVGYMRGAVDAELDGLVEGVKKDLFEEIEKALARLARKAARSGR